MTDYTKTTNFTAKDSLPSGNANKIVKGAEIDDEFDNIATAVATKSNIASPTFTGTVTGPTIVATTAFVPDAADGAALGTTSLEFSDLFLADGSIIYFGADQDTTITHVADTGLLINSTRQLQFGDSGTYIHQSADGVLDLVSDTEIEINATTIDMNGNLDLSGTLTMGSAAISEADIEQIDDLTAGTVTASKAVVVDSNKDIGSFRNITLTGELDAGSLDVSGDVDIDGTLETDALSINGTTITSTAAELNILDGVTSTAAELNILDGVTSTAAELNLLDGVTSTTAELNILDGVTASAADINLIDGITNGTVIASKAIITDSNKDITGGRNITISGELDAATLDISGDADIDGTLEADAITIGGVTLAETIADTVGAMVSSNTESGITVAYEDADNTLDFTVGTLNQDTTGTADNFTVSANNSTDETVYPVFVDGATGSQGAETDTGLTYNPSTGLLTATGFSGNLTGTLQTAAQTNITSLGTLTALTGGTGDFNWDSNTLVVDSSANRVGILNAAPDVTLDIGSATDAVHVPSGTTAQRPTGAAGYFRYNSTTSQFEGYTDSWGAIGGGGGSAPVIDTMTGDNSDTTLALSSAPLNENATFVTFDGVMQHKSTYSVSGSTLTFSTAPPTGVAVECITLVSTSSTTANQLLDADSDTKIQVEESSDEDTIRMDIAGTEMMTLSSSGAVITTSGNEDTLTLTSTDADANAGPNLRLYRNSGTPADSDALGLIEFEGRNDNTQDVVYAGIDSRIVDASDGIEDGRLEIVTMLAGTAGTSRILMDATETVVNDNSADLDFRVESDDHTHMLFVDAGNNAVGIKNTTPGSFNAAGNDLVVGAGTASDNNGITIYTNANSTGHLLFADGTSGTDGYTGYIGYNHPTNHMSFHTNAGVEKMRIDSSGNVTMPLQPAFLAIPATNQIDMAVNTNVTIVFGTELFDVGSNFASNTFTAPVTGKYQLNANIRLNNVDSAATYYTIYLITSNRQYYILENPGQYTGDIPYKTYNISVLADMDASDTAFVRFYQSGGTAQTDTNYDDGGTTFSGHLVC